jgi:hypothetical protein
MFVSASRRSLGRAVWASSRMMGAWRTSAVQLLSATSPIIALAMGPLRAALGPLCSPVPLRYTFCWRQHGVFGMALFQMDFGIRRELRARFIGMVNTLGAAVMVDANVRRLVRGVVSYQAVFARRWGSPSPLALSLVCPHPTPRIDKI